MAQLFDDDIVRVVQRFATEGTTVISSMERVVGKLGLAIDGVIRKASASAESIDKLSSQLTSATKVLRTLERSNRFSDAGQDIISKAIKNLARYTPARLELIQQHAIAKKESAVQKSTAMSAAFDKIKDQMGGVVKSNLDRLERNLYGLDRNARVMVMDIEATNKHVLEFHAKLVEFNKETGKLDKVVEQYTAYQRYANVSLSTAKRFDQALQSNARRVARLLPGSTAQLSERRGESYPIPRDVKFVGNKGLSLAQLTDAAGISATRIMHMAAKADAAIAHWPTPDLARLASIVPKLSSAVPWQDSSRGIPWRPLGFATSGLQPLLRGHGISARGAHRAVGDVDALIELLSSKHPQAVGGKTYADLMFRQTLGSGKDQLSQLTSVLADLAGEIRRDLYSTINASMRYQVNNLDAKTEYDKTKITARGKVDPAQDVIPPQLGASVLRLDADLRSVEEFLRNTLIVNPTTIAKLYNKHSEFAESRIGVSREFGTPQKDFVRTAQDTAVSIMRAVNEEIDIRRATPSKFRLGQIPLLPDVAAGREQTFFDRMLDTPQATRRLEHVAKYLDAAKKFAALRSADRLKVGAIVLDAEGQFAAAGTNRFADYRSGPYGPMVSPNTKKLLADRALKLKHIKHAETDALAMAGERATGGTIYVTHHPCADCASKIVEAGVKTVRYEANNIPSVVAYWQPFWDKAKEVFSKGGVALEEIGPKGELAFSAQERAAIIASVRKGSNFKVTEAVQLAKQIGPSDPEYMGLLQGALRRQTENKFLKRLGRAESLSGASILPDPEDSVIDVSSDALARLGRGRGRGRGGSQSGSIAGDLLNPRWLIEGARLLGSKIDDLFEPMYDRFVRSRTRARRQQQAGSIDDSFDWQSYYIRARGPLPDSTSLRGSMRRDALEAKLVKLADSAQELGVEMDRQRSILANKVQRAEEKYQDSVNAVSLTLANRRQAIDSQLSGVGARRTRIDDRAASRIEGVQSSLNNKLGALGLRVFETDLNLDTVVERQDRLRERLKKRVRDHKMTDSELEEVVSAPIRRAQYQKAKAQYQLDLARATGPEQALEIKKRAAENFARIRLGDPDTEEGQKAVIAYANRLLAKGGLIASGQTAAQAAAAKTKQITDEALAQKAEVDRRAEQLRARRQAAVNDAAARKSGLDATRQQIVDDAGTKSQAITDSGLTKIDRLRSTGMRARVAFLKAFDLEQGRGGGGRGGVGGGAGGGGGDDFASRSGFGLGLGFTAAAAYIGTIRELIKESTIYAARTETLVLTTEQMARVNGLNTEAVLAEVEAVKKLNITTQEAHTTVQKMIFAQLDAAKASNLARTAQDAAIIANVNSSQALDRIILGIVTGQTRVLHNMGLQVSMVNVMRQLRIEKRARGEEGEPTEIEKRQAMLNKVLAEGVKIMGTYERAMLTAGKQFNSLQREMQEAQNAVGSEFLPEFGRLVSLMTGGLRYVQGNGEAFASLLSILTSIGAAAATISTGAFFNWVMKSPGIPWHIKGLGVAAALGVHSLMNADDAKAMASTAGEQLGSLKGKITEVRKERAELYQNRANDLEFRQNWENSTNALKALSDSEVVIQQQLTKQLAEEYLKRLQNQKDYFDNKNNLDAIMHPVIPWWSKEAGFHERPIFGSGFTKKTTKTPSAPESGISEEDVKREAERIKAERARIAKLSRTVAGQVILNKELMESQAFATTMLQIQGRLADWEEKQRSIEGYSLRAKRAFASPREKIRLEYTQQEHELFGRTGMVEQTLALRKQQAEGATPELRQAARQKLEANFRRLGNENVEEGEKRFNVILEMRNEILKHNKENMDLTFAGMARQTQSQINQVKEQIDVENVLANVIQGNFTSERNAIDEIFRLKQDSARKDLALMNDVDVFNKRVAQNETDRAVAKLKLDQRIREGVRARSNARTRRMGDLAAQDILATPGLEPEEALRSAYRRRMDAISRDDDNAALEEEIRLTNELDDAIKKLGRDKARFAAEERVSVYDDQQQLMLEIDRIVSGTGRGRTREQRSIDEIERTRLSQRAVAQKEFAEFSGLPVNPGESRTLRDDDLRQQRDRKLRQADISAATATIKELDTQVEAARERLASVYARQIQQAEQVSQLLANNALEEQEAAHNTYLMRLDYIQKEFEARGKTLDAEKQKVQEMQNAEMDYLRTLLEQRRAQISSIRDMSGGLFDALFSQDRGASVKTWAQSIMKDIGKTMFQNMAVEVLKDKFGALGNVIKGQETVDAQGRRTPTLLGKILAGTPLGVSHTGEINERLANAMQLNVEAEKSLEQAIRSLDDAIRKSQGLIPGDKPATDSTVLPGIPTPGGNTTPLFGGANQNNPFIFHMAPASLGGARTSSGNVIVVDVARVGGVAIGPAVPVILGGSGGFGSTSTEDKIRGVFNGVSTILANNQGGGGGGWPGGSGGGGGSTPQNSPGIGTTESWGTTSGKVANVGAIAAGAYSIYSGIKRGGAKGTTGAIAGALTIASTIPGPQQPFIMAGAAIMHAVSSFMGDSIASRRKDIDKYLVDSKFIGPVAVNREMSARGNLLSYDKRGRSRDTGDSAFPIDIQQNVYRESLTSTNRDPDYIYVPGKILDSKRPQYGGDTYHITIPISAMDSKDVIARSRDIAAALHKELRLGGDLSVDLQNAVFGV